MWSGIVLIILSLIGATLYGYKLHLEHQRYLLDNQTKWLESGNPWDTPPALPSQNTPKALPAPKTDAVVTMTSMDLLQAAEGGDWGMPPMKLGEALQEVLEMVEDAGGQENLPRWKQEELHRLALLCEELIYRAEKRRKKAGKRSLVLDVIPPDQVYPPLRDKLDRLWKGYGCDVVEPWGDE